MTLTLIGALIAMIGFVLLFTASRLAMLVFVFACSLLNGAAVAIVTALGNVSIAPALMAAGFLLLRCVLPGRRNEPVFAASLADNGWLVLLVGYSVAGAFTLPFVFGGDIAVVPLRPTNNPLGLNTYPLQFSPQNITTASYMALTLTGAVCAHTAVRRADGAALLARMASAIALTHAGIGWFAALAKGTPLNAAVQFFRNGHYMQLDQSFQGFARLTGISPEPSLYASYGLVWFIFTAELWLRNVDRRWSGAAALVMGLTLLASTSSTAYVGLAAWCAVLMVRQMLLVGTIPARKGMVIAACALTLGASGLALVAGSDEAGRMLGRILRLTTTDKMASESGVARLLWARQGLDAFVHSWGLGIGAGSFRSSSILTAVLGSSGIIGLTALVMFLRQVFRPFAAATWRRTGQAEADVASAAAWAVVMVLIPASVSAPSSDPGLVRGLLAGSTLGLRRMLASRAAAAAAGGAGQTASDPVVLGNAGPARVGYRGGRESIPFGQNGAAGTA